MPVRAMGVAFRMLCMLFVTLLSYVMARVLRLTVPPEMNLMEDNPDDGKHRHKSQELIRAKVKRHVISTTYLNSRPR